MNKLIYITVFLFTLIGSTATAKETTACHREHIPPKVFLHWNRIISGETSKSDEYAYINPSLVATVNSITASKVSQSFDKKDDTLTVVYEYSYYVGNDTCTYVNPVVWKFDFSENPEKISKKESFFRDMLCEMLLVPTDVYTQWASEPELTLNTGGLSVLLYRNLNDTVGGDLYVLTTKTDAEDSENTGTILQTDYVYKTLHCTRVETPHSITIEVSPKKQTLLSRENGGVTKKF